MEAVDNDGLTTEVTFEGSGTAVVRVVGEIDISTVDAVNTAVSTAMDAPQTGSFSTCPVSSSWTARVSPCSLRPQGGEFDPDPQSVDGRTPPDRHDRAH